MQSDLKKANALISQQIKAFHFLDKPKAQQQAYRIIGCNYRSNADNYPPPFEVGHSNHKKNKLAQQTDSPDNAKKRVAFCQRVNIKIGDIRF